MSELSEEARYRAVLAQAASAPEEVTALGRALYDDSWRVRRAAAERLASVPDRPAALGALLGALADKGQTGARNAAAEALTRIGAGAVPALLELLAHPDPDQRKFAADILGEVRAAAGTEALVRALSDSNANVRVSAAEALGRLGGPAAVRALQDTLGVGEPLLQLAALEALRSLRAPPPLPTLRALLEHPALRAPVQRLLGQISEPGACELVCRGLASEARGVREAAFAALGQQLQAAGPARAELEGVLAGATRRGVDRQALVGALAADDESVRRGALAVARALADPSTALAVAEAAQDERLADEAAATLQALGPAAARAVLEQLGALSAAARGAASEALLRVAGPPLVPLLTELAASSEPDVRVAALRGLGKAQSLEALEPLVQLLSDPTHDTQAAGALVELAASYRREVSERVWASVSARPTPAGIFALARVGGGDAVELLRRTAKVPDARVRAASVEALASLDAADASGLARVALADEAVEVRAAGARAVGRLRVTDGAKLLRPLFSDAALAVRSAACEAAADAGFAELAGELKRAAGAPEGAVAAAAVRALGTLGALDAETLRSSAGHADPEVVKEALRAGAALAEAEPLAIRHLAHARWDVRMAAARTLAASGGRAAVGAVDAALERESDPLAREALQRAREILARR